LPIALENTSVSHDPVTTVMNNDNKYEYHKENESHYYTNNTNSNRPSNMMYKL